MPFIKINTPAWLQVTFSYLGKWHQPIGSAIIGVVDVLAILGTYKDGYEELKTRTDQATFWGLVALVFLTFIGTVIFWRKAYVRNQIIEADALIIANLEKEKSDLLRNHTEETEKLNTKIVKLKSVFAELNTAFGHIHLAARKEALTQEVLIETLTLFCTNFATVFDETTGQKCNVCIKLSTWQEQKFKNNLTKLGVFTLCRDVKNSKEDRRFADNEETVHIFEENTDFYILFQSIGTNNERIFFSNDLLSLKEYKNTSFLMTPHKTSNPFSHNTPREEKEKNWYLKYKSTIVAPICLRGSEGNTMKRKKSFQGFLCVDMEDVEKFDEIIHKEIVAGSAEALYNTLKTFRTLPKK